MIAIAAIGTPLFGAYRATRKEVSHGRSNEDLLV